ncbi:regulatory protein RecX [uncultured Desulfosarcina sp.]|uniref:regulatory protein RecX n=1 Tax=uncultured Desulfosarcina sp. TaxID=218289 RepID=UPI0029C9A652|nr:regulatory protein RecX [uncultured Desulfosarcina sp.]
MKEHDSRQHDSRRVKASASALDSAFRILARRDHTCKELAVKLRQKGFDGVAIDGALARCRELGYLDDAKTAAIIAGHLVESGYGPLRVRQTLRQKGLDDALIEQALVRCGDEETQVISARRMLEKRTSHLGREGDPWKRRQKACRFLAGRGFAATVINRAVADR